MTSIKKQQMEWRRNKIDELTVKGFSQSEIARMLSIDKSAVSRDVAQLKEVAEEIVRNHIQKTLPFEFQNCIKGLQEIIKESWIVAGNADKTGDNKEKLQSLALIKDTYSTKMELLTNASLLQDSIKFVENHKEKLNQGNKNGLEGLTETNRTEPESTNTIF